MMKGQVLKSPGGTVYLVVETEPRVRIRHEKTGVTSFVTDDLLERMKPVGSRAGMQGLVKQGNAWVRPYKGQR
jgi:hypothetical protein